MFSDSPSPTEPFRFALPPSLGEEQAAERASKLQDVLEHILERRAEVTVSPSYDALAKSLLGNRVDAIWGPPFVCARLEAMGVRVLARGIREGQSAYRAALVCRSDEPVTLETLAGKTAAWVDPNSVGGHLLAVAHLRSKGLDAQRLLFRQRFVGTYQAALEAVLAGHEHLTSIYAPPLAEEESILSGADALLPGASARLSVFALTDASPNDGIAISMQLPAESGKALETALVAMPEGPHSAALGEVFNVEGFEAAPRMGYRALYRVALSSL